MSAMKESDRSPEVMTPEQAAHHLQVNKETIYRYIRGGQLVASRLGRAYRIPRQSLDLLLWNTRTRQDIELRDYTGEEIAAFLREDQLDEPARRVAEGFTEADRVARAGVLARVRNGRADASGWPLMRTPSSSSTRPV